MIGAISTQDDSVRLGYNVEGGRNSGQTVHLSPILPDNMTTHVVKAREPTVLQGQSHYTLRPEDLMIGFKVRRNYTFRTQSGSSPP